VNLSNKKENLLRKRYENFTLLSRTALHLANQGVSRNKFLEEVSRLFVQFCECTAVEIRLKMRGKTFICESVKDENKESRFGISSNNNSSIKNDYEKLSNLVIEKRFEENQKCISSNGSLWINNATQPLRLKIKSQKTQGLQEFSLQDKYQSFAFLPFDADEQKIGLLVLKSVKKNYYSKKDVEFYEAAAQTVGLAASDRRAQLELRERVKELSCLYKISQLREQSDISLDKILREILKVIPLSWLYPEITEAQIILDGQCYKTTNYDRGGDKLVAGIFINNVQRGSVEVVYVEQKQEIDEGPFLFEERSLINEISKQISQILERKQSKSEKERLEDQLRHADRLATIGQLVSGVAHELNEPLGGILGFSQLALKNSELKGQIREDIEKIVRASLHAREVVKKLRLFARQMPSIKERVNLNFIIEESLIFLEARCVKNDIKLTYDLYTNLPDIIADSSQIQQVIINLVVNAIQAMPEGGKLKIKTYPVDRYVIIIVDDTGIGISKENQSQIFIPFFTTKDVDEGTGLGLSVVHGIVLSHKGSIQVESELGKGTHFEVNFPIHSFDDDIQE
jgi:signal transduction histidine kinase